MSNYDEYFTNDDKPFAENLNDALLLSNVFDMTVPIRLPLMFKNKQWINNISPRKAGVSIITLKELLPSGVSVSTVDNNSVLTGTGTVKLGFYPNFNSFGNIKSISWESTGTLTINLKTVTGSVIASNISKGTITNQLTDLMTLQEIVIEIVMNNATLNSLEIVMANKDTERYGAEVGITDVTGLESALNGKANSTHTHTKNQISDFSHTHDDRYYTENEIDTKFGWVEVDTLDGDFAYTASEGAATLEVNPTLRLAHLKFNNTRDYPNGEDLYTIGVGFYTDTYRPLKPTFVTCHQTGKYTCKIPNKGGDYPLCQVYKQTSASTRVTTYVDIIYKY